MDRIINGAGGAHAAGRLWNNAGRCPEARREMESVAAAYRRLYRSEYPELPNVLIQLALAYKRSEPQQPEAVVRALREANAVQTKIEAESVCDSAASTGPTQMVDLKIGSIP